MGSDMECYCWFIFYWSVCKNMFDKKIKNLFVCIAIGLWNLDIVYIFIIIDYIVILFYLKLYAFLLNYSMAV